MIDKNVAREHWPFGVNGPATEAHIRVVLQSEVATAMTNARLVPMIVAVALFMDNMDSR